MKIHGFLNSGSEVLPGLYLKVNYFLSVAYATHPEIFIKTHPELFDLIQQTNRLT